MSRLNLAESIPLSAPLAVYIEPTNVCNFRCGICPESFPDYRQQAGYYQHMSPEVWRSLLPDLKEIAPKVIRFFHTGEPLLNPYLPAMIRYAAEFCPRLEVTTNGSKLRGGLALQLIDSGLTYLRLSVYSTTNAGYALATGSRFTADEIRRGLQFFRTIRDAVGEGLPHIHAELVSNDSPDKFRQQYDGIADTMSVKSLHNWGSSDSRLVQLGKADRQVCPMPFYELVIKSNGLVTVCCVDWNNQLVVGDANRESLLDIWRGPKLRAIQEAHLEGNRASLPSCAQCTAFHGHPDNLDSLVGVKRA